MSLEIIKAFFVHYLDTIVNIATILVIIWALFLCWLLFFHTKIEKKRGIIIFFIRACFLVGIFLLALISISYVEALYLSSIIRMTIKFSTYFQVHISFVTMSSAFIEIYLNRNLTNKIIKDENNNKLIEKNNKVTLYDSQFGLLSSPKKYFLWQPELSCNSNYVKLLFWKMTFYLKKTIYYCVSRICKHGIFYIIGLILLLTLFTVIKAPYFDVSFTGEHSMKYNTYVEPAIYMHELNDPFWYQYKYKVDPVNNPQGIRSSFGSPPFIEWGLLATYKLIPDKSLEYNTRLFMHIIGLCILLSSYMLFAQLFTKNEALLITFLIAINPIINFISFVTVEDSLLILFTFLSLTYLVKHIKKNNIANLFFAGLFFGIGNASKASIFLWLFPIIIILLAFYSRKAHIFLRDITIILAISILPILAFQTSVRFLPADTVSSLIKLFIWVVTLYYLHQLIIKYESVLNDLFKKITFKKHYLFSAVLLSFIGGILFLNYTNLFKFVNEFLTDSLLILNWRMYQFILNDQLKQYMSANVYYLGLIGLLFIFLMADNKHKIALLAFLGGSVIYLVLASKVIFFHNYYTGIVMITFSLSIVLTFSLLSKSFQNKLITIYMLLILTIFIFPVSYLYNTARLSAERPYMNQFHQVADFLTKTTEKDNIYIDDSNLLTLTIMTGRGRVEEYHLMNDTLRKSVKDIGFASTMDKYGVVYLISVREKPRYERYVNLFSEENLASVAYRRSDHILSILDQDYEYFPDMELRQKIIEKENIVDKFILVQEFGPYKIYSFKD